MAIQEGVEIVVSNGSFKEQWGTAALIIKYQQYKKHIITETITTPGHPKD